MIITQNIANVNIYFHFFMYLFLCFSSMFFCRIFCSSAFYLCKTTNFTTILCDE